jgi:hypothetical protein
MMGSFDFDSKWPKWVKMCVFSGSLSMLVNGCPTRRPLGFVLIFRYCGGVESYDGKVGVAWLLWWLSSVRLTSHGFSFA